MPGEVKELGNDFFVLEYSIRISKININLLGKVMQSDVEKKTFFFKFTWPCLRGEGAEARYHEGNIPSLLFKSIHLKI